MNFGFLDFYSLVIGYLKCLSANSFEFIHLEKLQKGLGTLCLSIFCGVGFNRMCMFSRNF